MYFLEAENIVKRYENHVALEDVTIRVPQGKIFGLLGPNGAGKTTLIRTITRITAPDEGRILFDGRPFHADDVFRIGYLPEERGLYKKMKVGEQAIYFARLKGLSKKDAHEQLTEWFEKFEIMPWWNRKLEELSKGMQQKVQFIITVVHNPDLIIFDEPFSGFDPVNAELLKNEMLQLKANGHTLIFSTHNMASVEEICDEIALIDRSKVVLNGNVNEIRNQYRSNEFIVQLPRDASLQSSSVFTILSEAETPVSREVILRKEKDIRHADLMMDISRQSDIISFAEKLPTMNEIFIQTVNRHSNTSAHE